MQEYPNPNNGCIYAHACGPLTKPRYINMKLEKELIQFRKEVEIKFAKAPTNAYKFLKGQEAHFKIRDFLKQD
jgi:hypothetical protein